MNNENIEETTAENEPGQDYLSNPFGHLTTSGECEVIKAADVKKDSAEKEESR